MVEKDDSPNLRTTQRLSIFPFILAMVMKMKNMRSYDRTRVHLDKSGAYINSSTGPIMAWSEDPADFVLRVNQIKSEDKESITLVHCCSAGVGQNRRDKFD